MATIEAGRDPESLPEGFDAVTIRKMLQLADGMKMASLEDDETLE